MRRGLALGLAAALLLVGCIGTSKDPSTNESLDTASAATAPGAGETASATVYDFADVVAGASAPNPQGNGPAAGPVPVALQQTFEVGEDALALSFDGEVGAGTGSARIEVHDPEGALVCGSDRHFVAVGAPGVGGASLFNPVAEASGDAPVPGTYTVSYYVAGVFGMALEVTAEVPPEPTANA